MIGPELSFTPRGLYIGGEWQEAAEGGRLASISPSTGEHLGEVPAATQADVDRAVRAGRAAFESDWGRMPMRERTGYARETLAGQCPVCDRDMTPKCGQYV